MSIQNTSRDLFTLLRWLGPWADEDKTPSGIERHEEFHPVPGSNQKVKTWTYIDKSRAPKGAYLIGPGLHFKGAEHEGLDRFARILAKAGNLIMSPFVEDFSNMHIQPNTHVPFLGAFDALLEHRLLPPGIKPGVFSISFGSWLAMKLATCPVRNSRLGASVVFGGYGNFQEAVDFAISGELNGERYTHHDPRNVPAIFMHIADTFDVDAATLRQAWLKYMRQTWQIDTMKSAEACHRKAKSLALELPIEFRDVFLEGCGALPGAQARVRASLADKKFDYLDTRSDFHAIQCPVFIMHGTDDDVIPYTQLESLSRELPLHVEQETYLTGLYGHSSQDGQARTALVNAAFRELTTMVRMLKAIHRGGRMSI
ncbi:MAG: alpha/beta hydrolase [Deltaproteobacteria bacterium]|jgi:pimeloyl-ACP methyl ester carboxylesterase|nr:alpha/beta hydrolase [Deltaproteobacteria bacterium]MBT6432602.1 alpha/beta hydrolase [Deltaproteobacteria bacterium]MBT6492474.1 alpha/beta hydrolase [Deltaproteobacteria bacterium]